MNKTTITVTAVLSGLLLLASGAAIGVAMRPALETSTETATNPVPCNLRLVWGPLRADVSGCLRRLGDDQLHADVRSRGEPLLHGCRDARVAGSAGSGRPGPRCLPPCAPERRRGQRLPDRLRQPDDGGDR